MRLIGKISKIFMIVLGIISFILLITKSGYSTMSCIFLFINGIVAAVMMRKSTNKVQDRSYIRHKLALDALNGAVWEWDSVEKVLYISSRLKKTLHTNTTIDTFEKFYKFIQEEDREYIRNFFDEVIKDRITDEFTLEFTIKDSNGKSIIMECSGKGEVKGNLFLLTGVLLDTTEKREQDRLLRLSEKNYRRALEGSQDIMFYINIQNNEITLNNKIFPLLEIEAKIEYKLSNDKWVNDYIIDADRDIFKSSYRKFVDNNNDYLYLEYRIQSSSGKLIWIRQRGKRIIEEDGVYIYGSLSNITENKEKELRIYYMSHFDNVTGIPNRRYFTEKAKRMLLKSIENKSDFAIIFMDLDNFKYVNDTYGHDSGDELLRKFCKKLESILNENCTLARFGGDEFIIAVEKILHKGEIIRILQRIIDTFNFPLEINEKDIYCTVSIGVSMRSSDGNSIESLLKKADLAMYKAKSSGKNQYFIYNQEVAEQLGRELAIKNSLRKAIRDKEIYFDLQPKYWCEDSKLQGFECLARWNSKELGFVSPTEFIGVAESTGLIVAIGDYLIEDGFKKSVEISKYMGTNFKLAINLSQVQIRDDNLIYFIEKKLIEYDVNPKTIEFEVTESAIMKSPEKNIELLKRLKGLGVSIALDDFGTGYSSLNYLKILPIDTVKIDKSFVDDIGIDNKNEFIIEKTIELCHLLELDVVAEGVESKSQLNYLKKINCDIIQGYYFSKPQGFDNILEIIKSNNE